jgi:hypothetical protein
MNYYITRFWLSSLIVLLPLFPLKPCGDYYNSNEVRVTNFMDNALQFNDLTKYVFTTDFYKNDYTMSTGESEDINVEQWFAYCKDKNVDRKDIYDFLYVFSGDDIIKKKGILSKNTFLHALRNNKEALDYLFLIRRTPSYGFKVAWDDFGNDEYRSYYYGLGTIVYPTMEFDSLIDHTKDDFLKHRYAYQSLIAHFYEEFGKDTIDSNLILKIFDTHFKNGKKDWMYYSALHYAAYFLPNGHELRLDCIINGSDKQARNIELLYASPAFKSFFATEKDPVKRSYLLAVRAMRNMGPCLADLKEIYQLNPKNIYLNFLLNREVNKIEDWILTPKFTAFKPYVASTQAARNYQKDLVYTNAVLDFTSQLKSTNNEMFLTLINSYLNYILNRPEKAFQILNSTKSYANETLDIQARTIAVLIRLSEKNVTAEIENEICSLIKRAPGSEFRNQFIRSCSALLLKMPAQRAKGFLLLSQSWYPREYFGNDIYYNLHGSASVKEIYEVVAIINKPNKSILETFISMYNDNMYSWDESMVEKRVAYDTLKMKNLIAMKHMNADELEKALAVYTTFPNSYWEKSYFDDPFTFSIFDEHNHSRSDKIGYTKKQFLEKLIEYKKELALKPNDPLLNYYVGNAYLSLTWFGKNWYMADIGWNSGGFEYREKSNTQFDKNYYQFSRALPYIKKAAANSSDKKLQTLAKLNLAYCYSTLKNKRLEDFLDVNTREYYSEVELNCDVYVQYLNHYRLVDKNYTPVVKLKRFEYFEDRWSN